MKNIWYLTKDKSKESDVEGAILTVDNLFIEWRVSDGLPGHRYRYTSIDFATRKEAVQYAKEQNFNLWEVTITEILK